MESKVVLCADLPQPTLQPPLAQSTQPLTQPTQPAKTPHVPKPTRRKRKHSHDLNNIQSTIDTYIGADAREDVILQRSVQCRDFSVSFCLDVRNTRFHGSDPVGWGSPLPKDGFAFDDTVRMPRLAFLVDVLDVLWLKELSAKMNTIQTPRAFDQPYDGVLHTHFSKATSTEPPQELHTCSYAKQLMKTYKKTVCSKGLTPECRLVLARLQYLIQGRMTTTDMCTSCGGQLIALETADVCRSCGTEHHTNRMFQPEFNHKQYTQEIRKSMGEYNPLKYLHTRLSELDVTVFDGNSKEDVVIDTVLQCMHKDCVRVDDLDWVRCKQIMAGCGLSKYYRYANRVVFRINGKRPPILEPHKRQELVELFEVIMAVYAKMPIERKSMVGYNVLEYMFFLNNDLREFLPYCPLPHSINSSLAALTELNKLMEDHPMRRHIQLPQNLVHFMTPNNISRINKSSFCKDAPAPIEFVKTDKHPHSMFGSDDDDE